MMFAAHTRWPAMWLGFLAITNSLHSVCVCYKRIATFWRWVVMYYHILREWRGWLWRETLLSSVSKSHLRRLCRKSNFHLLQNTPQEGDSTARTRLIDLTSCWLTSAPPLTTATVVAASATTQRSSGSVQCTSCCEESDQLCTSCTQEFPHSFWRSSRRCDVVFAEPLPLYHAGIARATAEHPVAEPVQPTNVVPLACTSQYVPRWPRRRDSSKQSTTEFRAKLVFLGSRSQWRPANSLHNYPWQGPPFWRS